MSCYRSLCRRSFKGQPDAFQINSAQLVGCVVIAFLTMVNLRGLREGALVQNLFTVLKAAALLALIVAGLTHFRSAEHFSPWLTPIPGDKVLEGGFLAGLAVALSKALFAYDAWNSVTFVAEEVHDSPRTLPRALLLGSLTVMALYVLTNVAYLAVLPVSEIAAAQEDRVAQLVATTIFGPVGSTLVIAAILVSTFGCLNGLILSGAGSATRWPARVFSSAIAPSSTPGRRPPTRWCTRPHGRWCLPFPARIRIS